VAQPARHLLKSMTAIIRVAAHLSIQWRSAKAQHSEIFCQNRSNCIWMD